MPRAARSSRPDRGSGYGTSAATDRNRERARQNNRADHRYPPARRLADAAAFRRVFGKAGKSRDNLFLVLSRANEGGEPRLGLAISRKNCRLATDRNRIKRIVRESFRQHLRELAGLDIVVLGQPGLNAADNAELFASLARHWRRTRARHGGG